MRGCFGPETTSVFSSELHSWRLAVYRSFVGYIEYPLDLFFLLLFKCQSPSARLFIKIFGQLETKETVPRSVIPFFALSKFKTLPWYSIAFTQLLLASSNSLCCKTPCHKFEDAVLSLASFSVAVELDYLGRPVRAVKTRQSNLARRFSVPSRESHVYFFPFFDIEN